MPGIDQATYVAAMMRQPVDPAARRFVADTLERYAAGVDALRHAATPQRPSPMPAAVPG